MNLFQLILKQMRQRALSTWLTTLSVMLGVTLAITTLILQREGKQLLAQSEFGYDILVGPKGSRLQLVLNTIYQLDTSPGLINYSVYGTMPELHFGRIKFALPTAVGDTYQGLNVIATLPKAFDTPDMRRGFDLLHELREVIAPNKPNNPDAVGVLERLTRAEPGSTEFADGARRLEQLVDEMRALVDIAWQIDEEAHLRLRGLPDKLAGAIDAVRASPPRVQEASTTLRETLQTLRITGPLLHVFQYRPDRGFSLAEGRPFHRLKFEAVIGAEVSARTGLKLGDTFQAEHGTGSSSTSGKADHDHDETWTVVGVLEKTNTAFDRVILIPLITFFAIPAHGDSLEAFSNIRGADEIEDFVPGQAIRPTPVVPRPPVAREDELGFAAPGAHAHPYFYNDRGELVLELPKSKWKLSAIFVKTLSIDGPFRLMSDINNAPDATAVNPAMVMREFFDTFFSGWSLTLIVFSVLVTVVAAVSILVSIYNSIAARRREIAILRALGATRLRVLTLICVEAGLIGLVGGILGFAAGHALAGIGSIYTDRHLGITVNWLTVSQLELIYLAGVTLLATIAGLVPAVKAYETQVAANLVAD
jgi:putative ABC transport system permease protein